MAKTFVLVGATSGIGRQLAAELAGPDTTLYVLGRRGDRADDTPGVVHARCDVTAEAPQFPEVDEPIDGLAYLPGTINLKPFHLLRRRDFAQDMEVNFFGAVKTIQHYLPQLRRSEAASVVLMSTVAVQTGLAFHASIAGAKGAIEGLTRSLAAELAPKIRVNAVASSLTDTPLAESLLNQPAKRENAAKRHPLKRVGSPRDIAAAVCSLLEDDSSWITGQVLAVDGSWLAELRKQDPDWVRGIGRVVNPQLFARKDLKPDFTAPGDSVYGWDLDLSVIVPTAAVSSGATSMHFAPGKASIWSRSIPPRRSLPFLGSKCPASKATAA